MQTDLQPSLSSSIRRERRQCKMRSSMTAAAPSLAMKQGEHVGHTHLGHDSAVNPKTSRDSWAFRTVPWLSASLMLQGNTASSHLALGDSPRHHNMALVTQPMPVAEASESPLALRASMCVPGRVQGASPRASVAALLHPRQQRYSISHGAMQDARQYDVQYDRNATLLCEPAMFHKLPAFLDHGISHPMRFPRRKSSASSCGTSTASCSLGHGNQRHSGATVSEHLWKLQGGRDSEVEQQEEQEEEPDLAQARQAEPAGATFMEKVGRHAPSNDAGASVRRILALA